MNRVTPAFFFGLNDRKERQTDGRGQLENEGKKANY